MSYIPFVSLIHVQEHDQCIRSEHVYLLPTSCTAESKDAASWASLVSRANSPIPWTTKTEKMTGNLSGVYKFIIFQLPFLPPSFLFWVAAEGSLPGSDEKMAE